MTDIIGPRLTETVGQAVITWQIGAPQKTRELMHATTRRPRPVVNRRRDRELAGRRALALPDSVQCDTQRQVIVRIYYRSQGDEILYLETDPLSPRAAEVLRTEHGTHGPSDALSVQWFCATQPEDPLPGSRRAALPSQSTAVVQTTVEESPANVVSVEESPAPVELPPQAPRAAVTQNTGSLFQAAAARRAQRVARWRASCTVAA